MDRQNLGAIIEVEACKSCGQLAPNILRNRQLGLPNARIGPALL